MGSRRIRSHGHWGVDFHALGEGVHGRGVQFSVEPVDEAGPGQADQIFADPSRPPSFARSIHIALRKGLPPYQVIDLIFPFLEGR